MPAEPDLTLESQFWERGLARVAGVDEAGRGAWAGPVVVAAVILPAGKRDWPFRDSKALSAARREALAAQVRREALAWSVEFADAGEVDRYNVLGATRRAALRAVRALAPAAQALVTDYLPLDADVPCLAVARADSRSCSVAAASLLAKVTRDEFMRRLEDRHPGYGFSAHKGYGVPAHRSALARLGPCEEHRRSFAPVAQRAMLPTPPSGTG